MGMFDNVKCEVPLPDGWIPNELQTKSFEVPYLELYTITSAGRLIHNDEDMNFHGVLNFYGSTLEPGGHVDWHEYNAKFTDGHLVEIDIVENKG